MGGVGGEEEVLLEPGGAAGGVVGQLVLALLAAAVELGQPARLHGLQGALADGEPAEVVADALGGEVGGSCGVDLVDAGLDR